MKYYTMCLCCLFFLLTACGDDSDMSSGVPADDSDAATKHDADSADIDDEVSDTDAVPAECREITVSDIAVAGASLYAGVVTPDLGDSELNEVFSMQFYEPGSSTGRTVMETGSYDLSAGDNKNYATCSECLLVYEDTSESGNEKTYFQRSGTLTVESIKEGTIESAGSFTVILEEVTLDDSYNSTPVADGDCLYVRNATFDTICLPDCEGKICGGDGCGGSCGDGCGSDEYCSADQSSCEPYSCTSVTLGEITTDDLLTPEYTALYTPVTGDEALYDLFTMLFYNTPGEPAEYDLSTETNRSLSTCEQCLVIQEDIDEDAETVGTYFFQQKGTITVSDVLETEEGGMSGESVGTFSNVRLIEVAVDSLSGETEPVQDGRCFEIESASWDTVCVPDCTDRICGTDGCGGTCGAGCDINDQCNAAGTACVPYECTEISVEDLSVGDVYPDNPYYSYTGEYTPATGMAGVRDDFSLQFYEVPELDITVDLSGDNYRDCTHCLLVYEDIDETKQTVQRTYFQQKGTIDVSAFDAATGEITAAVTDLRLIEVTIGGDYSSTPVQPGKCLTVSGVLPVSASPE